MQNDKIAVIVYAPCVLKYDGPGAMEHSVAGIPYILNGDMISGNHFDNLDILSQYSHIIVNLNIDVTYLETILRIREMLPSTVKVIGLAEGAYQDILRRDFIPECHLLMKIMQSFDAYCTIVDRSGPFYQMLTDKPVLYLGIPFWEEVSRRYRLPADVKFGSTPIVAVNGVPPDALRALSRNFIGNLYLTKQSDTKVNLITRKPIPDTVSSFMADNGFENVTVHDTTSYDKFYEIYSRCTIGINLDSLGTWGRWSLDLASMGIPVIGSIHQQTQYMLFPDLTFDPMLDIDKAVKAYQILLDDRGFYNHCREYALNIVGTEFATSKFIERWNTVKCIVDS